MVFDALNILAPTGPVAHHLGERFEFRPQQADMARAVDMALRSGGRLVIEAGTGVGKSFAYLLPAVGFILAGAAASDEKPTSPDTDGEAADSPGQPAPQRPSSGRRRRVIISTHTIALQEQLIEKDIPLIQSIVPDEFSAVLVKGRGNYLSLRRLRQAADRQHQLFPDLQMLEALRAIEEWAEQTEDGSLATLPQHRVAQSVLRQIWDKVQSDSGNCMGRRCPFCADCFYQRARRGMERADLLVVNHSLFFADLALRSAGAGFLPDYDAVIIDEAHTIEDVASEHFGMDLSQSNVWFLLHSLYGARTGRGFLSTLAGRGRLSGEGRSLLERAVDAVRQAESAMTGFFESLAEYQETRGRGNGRIDEPRIVPDVLGPAMTDLANLLKILRDHCEMEDDRFELAGYAGRCEAMAAGVAEFLEQTLPDCVYWIESGMAGRDQSLRRLRLVGAPVDVAPLLKEHLFSATTEDRSPVAVILTSATLATRTIADGEAKRAGGGDPFAYLRSRLGCDDQDTATLQLGSPFDYEKQARLIINASLPDPNDAQYFEQLGPCVLKHIDETDGGAFVLFTNFDLLRRTAQWLEPHLRKRNMPLMVHGDGEQRTVLLDKFRGGVRGVLLGADSFWQGVDVRGDALRNVIITRLPFDVPDRPLIESRIERIESRGGNAFMEYSLPEAVLRFKQGFGRLIRSKTDIGQVVVLDSRIVKKPYGRRFIDALPKIPLTVIRS